MRKVFCLLNHELTERQIEELKSTYEVENIFYPPENIANLWSQIPPNKEFCLSNFNGIIAWLSELCFDDVLVIQGEMGAVFSIVDWALHKNVLCLYAVTKRVETEERQGEKVIRHYVFEHICFREYKYFSDLA